MVPCGSVEGWSIIYCSVGAMLLIISMFIPRWRLDAHGTSALQEFLMFRGFETRSYGLLHVVGSFSQSWNTLTGSTCEFRDLSQVSAIGQTLAGLFREGTAGGCDGSEQCSGGFFRHMEQRCRMYERLWTLSSVTVAFTFLSVSLVACGALTYTLSNRRRTSGVIFGLNLFAGILSFVMNTAWAFVSDSSFKSLMETGWFPYPSLAIGYWLHLFGAIVILVACGVFGWLTLEASCDYDPTQDKIDKRNKKLQKLKKAHSNLQEHCWKEGKRRTAAATAATTRSRP